MGIISLHISALIQKKTAYKKAQVKPQKQHDSILTSRHGIMSWKMEKFVAMLESKGGIG
jgi:hypothetical protein